MKRFKVGELALLRHPDLKGEEFLVVLRHTDHLYNKFLIDIYKYDIDFYDLKIQGTNVTWVDLKRVTYNGIKYEHLVHISPETDPEYFL